MDVNEAINAVQVAKAAGRLFLSSHVRNDKLPLLGIYAGDVGHVVDTLTADESHEQDNGTFKLYGFTADGTHMAIVVDVDDAPAEVVVITIHPYP